MSESEKIELLKANRVIPDITGNDSAIDIRNLHPMLVLHVQRVDVINGITEEQQIIPDIIDEQVADMNGTRDTNSNG